MKMKSFSVPQAILLVVFSILIVKGTSARRTTLSSKEFISQLLNQNKVDRYKSLVSRMRRAAPSPLSSSTKFSVGKCPIHEFFDAAKNCSKVFYAETRKKGATRKQCGSKFTGLQQCLKDTLRNCMKGSFVNNLLTQAERNQIQRNFLTFLGNEKFWCEKGGVGISSEYLPVGSACDPVFLHVSEGCTATYTRLFNTSSTSNDRLCSEYQKAKNCFLHALIQHCSFDRTLLQILEILIEISADFQPFCKSNAKKETLKFEDLFVQKTCPPHSLSDVAFLLDVTNATTAKEFMAMKRLIGILLNKMDFGWNGIYVAVYHFDVQLRAAIKFGRTNNKGTLHRLLRRMARSPASGKSKKERMTGRALSSLARNTFSPHKVEKALIKKPTKSGRRPYNGAIAFVLTTGPSNDSMIRGLNELKERNVHVAFVGPPNVNMPSTTNSETPKRINTSFKWKELKKVVSSITDEICMADMKRSKAEQARLAEGVQQKSNLSHIRARIGRFDLSLLFELKPFLQTYQEPQTLPPISEFNVVENRFGGGKPSEYIDGMDGDINYSENVMALEAEINTSPTNDYPGMWPYEDIEEFPGYGL